VRHWRKSIKNRETEEKKDSEIDRVPAVIFGWDGPKEDDSKKIVGLFQNISYSVVHMPICLTKEESQGQYDG
jgi:hypothetical protein